MQPRLHASHRGPAAPPARPHDVQEIRDPVVTAALEAAIASPNRDLFGQLARRSGLPGPRPNLALAHAVAWQVARAGRKADALVRDLLACDAERAPAGTVQEFLPIVGAACLAARHRAGVDPRGAMDDLERLAEDPRHLVRSGVVAALRVVGQGREAELVDDLAAWMDGYLQAAVAVEAIGDRELLAALRSPDAALARVDEAFEAIESAPRSHERTQGWRALVHALAEAPVLLLARFPDATADLLVRRVATKVPEIRDAVAAVIERARGDGHAHALVQRLRDALAAADPPPRDLGSFVPGTRGRGRKAGRSGKR
jgi:hypothetical protein